MAGRPGRPHSDEALLAHIRAIHAEVKGEYGWPRMHKELLARGIRVGKDRVRKLMQLNLPLLDVPLSWSIMRPS